MKKSFSPREHEIARQVAEQLMFGDRVGNYFSENPKEAETLERFLENPKTARLTLRLQDRTGVPSPPSREDSFEISREQFFNAWLQEISDRHPEMIQIDTLEDARYLDVDICTRLSEGLRVANISEASKRARSYLADHGDSDKARTIIPIATEPFRVIYVHAGCFMRNCHAETGVSAYAIMTSGMGYFSYPVDGQWTTRYTERGSLCTEPAGGIHAGQACEAEILGILTPTKREANVRSGIVKTIDMNRQWPSLLNPLHQNEADGSYCYALKLEDGLAVSNVPAGIYWMYETKTGGRCFLDGVVRRELQTDDVVSWIGNGMDGKGSLGIRCSGGPVLVLAVCRQPLKK